MSRKSDKTLNKHPACTTQAKRGGKNTREGATSGVGLLERMKHGNGIKDREDKSNGIEILIVETFVKINPLNP